MIICLLMNKFHLLNVWVLLYFILLDIEYTLVELYKQPVVPPPPWGSDPPLLPLVSAGSSYLDISLREYYLKRVKY